MKPKIIILGAGGHGKVVCDAVLRQNTYELLGFLDGQASKGMQVAAGFKVIGDMESLEVIKQIEKENCFFIVAIGDNTSREKFYTKAAAFLNAATVIHPSAILNSGVELARSEERR